VFNKHTPNFSSRDLFQKIGSQKTSREYRNKETIFRQGDAADAMFYVQDGSVKVTVTSRGGKRDGPRNPAPRRRFWRALSRQPVSVDVDRNGNSPIHYRPSEAKHHGANNAARACVCKTGDLLSPLSHYPNRGRLRRSDLALQRKAISADSRTTSPFWEAIRVEICCTEAEPTNSRGDGGYDTLTSELLHERL